MKKEDLTQAQLDAINAHENGEELLDLITSNEQDLNDEQLENVVGGFGASWNSGKVKCSCGSEDVEMLQPEEINPTTHQTVQWYRCRKCRREFYV